MRELIYTTAQSYVGTPFVPQGRLPGIGLDCIGVPICVAWALGLADRSEDVRGYTISADGTMPKLLRKYLRPTSDPKPGDIGAFMWDGDTGEHHLGVLTPRRNGRLMMVHALGPRSPCRVIESAILPKMRMLGAYSFPGVD
jgi:uncharacterized protein YijF (DUF1287 family)